MDPNPSAEWLAPTDIARVSTASDETLRRTLLTCDGAGERIKIAALKELSARAFAAGVDEGIRQCGARF